MARNLTNIPYEVLTNIVRHVDFQDTINLGRTCKVLSQFHYSDSFCRVILDDKAPFSKEAREARLNGQYATALRRLARRREAFASANPYSVAVLGHATSFRYDQGVLCYTSYKQLRILDLHGSADKEDVINIPLLLIQSVGGQSSDTRTSQDPCQHGTFEVLYYRDNIVSCIYKSLDLETGWLLAINVQSRKLLLKHRLLSIEKIFVRHTYQFLYYGTHSTNGHDGHRRWEISGYHFEKEEWLTTFFQLPRTVGSDVSSTVCFEIYEDNFYALSSQTSFEMEEIDWTSYYHCCRFPLESPCLEVLENAEAHSMWRRQHKEGPIDDRWTTLELEIDEEKGGLVIIEARKEWKDGASRSQRTYYRTALVFPPQKEYRNMSVGSSSSYLAQALPTNDPLVRALTSSDKPQWREARPRFPRNVHEGDDGLTSSSSVLKFPKTKIRSYNCSANAFLDLINDPAPGDWQEKQRLRLRVGSRTLDAPKRYGAGHPREGQVEDTQINPETGDPCSDLNETYTSKPIEMWPPESPASAPLFEILNPDDYQGEVEGVADNRSVVYTTGSAQGPPSLVFINFDPLIWLSGLKDWGGNRGWKLGVGEGPHIDGRASGGSKKNDEKGKSIEQTVLLQDRLVDVTTHYRCAEDKTGPEWFTRQAALYTRIKRGFWTLY